jgi:sugar O-acyltransferase (sialic acid O-acetyltransferase NeuD family)
MNLPTELPNSKPGLIIFGGGGHAKSIIDLVLAEKKWSIIGIVDDGIEKGSSILGIPVLGDSSILPSLRETGIHNAVNAVGGIGDVQSRLAVFERLRGAGFTLPTVVHPHAFIEPSARVGDGCHLLYGVYVGSDVRIGFGCLLNSGVILSHDCVLGDYVNLSPGALFAGAVTVGDRAQVGMGVTINLGLHIGAGARVGNSAVIKADVPDDFVVHAGEIWPHPGPLNEQRSLE